MRKMCSKSDKTRDAALRHHHPTTKPTTTTATTSTIKTTATITTRDERPNLLPHDYTDECMWWWHHYHYQPKPSSVTTTATTTATTTTTTSNNCWSRRRRRRGRLQHWLSPFLAFALIVSLWDVCSAAPQSCILCDKEDLKAGASPHATNYEEFLFEHQVTRQDAINALRALNESFYIGPSPDNSCKSVACTKNVMKYCLGPQFINDHCLCELGHTYEGLPYIPHICYVGEKVHSPSVGSCFFYEEVKDCCCAPALAKQWRHISAAPRPLALQNSLSLVTTSVLLVLMIASAN